MKTSKTKNKKTVSKKKSLAKNVAPAVPAKRLVVRRPAEPAAPPSEALEELASQTASAVMRGDCAAAHHVMTGAETNPPPALCALLDLFQAQRDTMRDVQVRLRDVGSLLLKEGREPERVRAFLRGLWNGYQDSMLQPTTQAVEALAPFPV